jgi:site-specific DNA recombinase
MRPKTPKTTTAEIELRFHRLAIQLMEVHGTKNLNDVLWKAIPAELRGLLPDHPGRVVLQKGTAAATTAIYTRISKDNQNGKGVERQLEDCRILAKKRGWPVAEELEDNDISASKYTRRRRPGYTRLMGGVAEGRITRVVCWKLDRLYRKPKELETLIDLAEDGRVQIVTVMGGELDLNSSAGRTMARVGVAMAAGSSDDTSERIVRMKQQRRAAGSAPGGRRPFGWKSDSITPDPAESKVLIAAIDKILAGGSLTDVAREWTKAKVRGRTWGPTHVKRTVTLPHHAALLRHKGEIIGTGTWRPLITRDKWEQVCAAVEGRSLLGTNVARRRSMLTGILRCVCGEVMYRSSTGGVKIWRCHKGGGRGKQNGCGKINIRASLVEPVVVEATFQVMDTMDLASLMKPTNDNANIARELVALDRREAAAGRSAGLGKISLRMAESLKETIEVQRKDLRTRLARQTNGNVLAPFAGRPGVLRGTWDTLSDDQRRSIIGEALGTVAIMPTTAKGRTFDSARIVIGTRRSTA